MRRRIVGVSGATTALVLIAFLVPLLVLVRQIAQTRAMAEATANAQTVATVLLSVSGRDQARLGVESVNAAGPLRTTVFYPDGTQLGAPARADDDVELARNRRTSFDTAVSEGRAVYLAVDLGDGPCCAVVRTYVPESRLRSGVVQASVVLAVLALVLLLIALFVAQVLARSLVRPLVQVSQVAHALYSGDLTRRAEPSGPPEIAAIGATLNRLARRIDVLLQTERETVADLSHRIRTPLTALRLDVESLADPEEAERLMADVDEVERSVNHTIEYARLPDRQGADPHADLSARTRDRLAFWAILAREQGREVSVDVSRAEVTVPVSGDKVDAVVDALVGNIFAHTPAGTSFAVSVVAGPPVRLVIGDEGPGLSDPALLDRGRSGAGSTGLGLDIARRTAEASGGTLEVGAGPGGRGLRVVVTFGGS
ncbi:MAG TPA: HAMP domain-containing sensor histidine kinase [Kineosporiaceae bacterium]|nr:HAMP domain-containing sensor histidine kinase [Kineosporiaceae bacterium]